MIIIMKTIIVFRVVQHRNTKDEMIKKYMDVSTLITAVDFIPNSPYILSIVYPAVNNPKNIEDRVLSCKTVRKRNICGLMCFSKPIKMAWRPVETMYRKKNVRISPLPIEAYSELTCLIIRAPQAADIRSSATV